MEVSRSFGLGGSLNGVAEHSPKCLDDMQMSPASVIFVPAVGTPESIAFVLTHVPWTLRHVTTKNLEFKSTPSNLALDNGLPVKTMAGF